MLADTLKMTLSEEKTRVTHLNAGFDFLRIRRKRRGDGRPVVRRDRRSKFSGRRRP